MPIEITMPSLSANMEAGVVARWLVREGDAVKRGDVIAEIETDKATMEMESSYDGVLARILAREGVGEIRVGQPIALLASDGEEHSDSTGSEHQSAPAARGEVHDPKPESAAATDWREPSRATQASKRRIKASPIARRLARQHRVDLALIQGTGPGGRIVKVDVETAAHAGQRSTNEPVPRTSVAARVEQPGNIPHDIVKLSSMRRAIARRLSESKATIPHFYLTIDAQLDSLLKLRSELNEALELKVSVNDMLVRALGIALRRVPDANVQYAGDQLYKFKRADVSVAVAVPGGLVTPVVHDCASKSVSVIASEMKGLIERARSGKLAPEEYQGGTASLSNLGMYGVKQFEAIINPPQALIVAVGAAEKRPIVVGDEIRMGSVMSITASFDHRAIDGAVGAEFISALKAVIEKPLLTLI